MNIAALISGGVDSAVVVHLLCEQGYKPDLSILKSEWTVTKISPARQKRTLNYVPPRPQIRSEPEYH